MSDRRVLFAGALLRSLATGMIGVLLGVHLARVGLDPAAIGSVIGAGLAGGALAALLVTVAGDRLGRRRTMVALALLSGLGGLAFAVVSSFPALAACAFAGMVNGMGRDRGGALILDQAILPSTAADRDRTRVFAWYNVLQDGGGAFGGLLAALPTLLRSVAGVPHLPALRIALLLYAALFLAAAVVYTRLSAAVEPPADGAGREVGVATSPDRGPRIGTGGLSAHSRRVVLRISSLFAIDSLAGGLLTTALLSFFFFERFGVEEGVLGVLFFVARVANAGSHLGAALLARRFGLVNTMVFTHIPSSLLLVTVAYAPNFTVAALLFVLREGLVEMDVPTRQSYVMAVVRPEERTVAAGITSLVRLAAWSVGPWFAGWFMRGVSLTTPLLVGSGMKVAYDLLLYAAFRRLRPPEEHAGR